MRHSHYVHLFRGLAETHGRIRHTEQAPRFARVIVSIDPLQRVVDMAELSENVLGQRLKPGPGDQVLVLESCQTIYRDNGGDNRVRRRHGAFMVLEQAVAGNFDDIERTIDRTEETGEQLLAAVLDHFKSQVKVRWDVSDITSDTLGPLGDGTWYGTRFDFEFTNPANAAFSYNPAHFLPIL